eukprot:236090-Rhodomonas_salina.1
MPVKRQPDSDISKESGVALQVKRQRGSPVALLEGGHSKTCDSSSNSRSSSPGQTMDFSVVARASFQHRIGECIVAPEHPLAFPQGTVHGLSLVVSPSGRESQWPPSLVRLFKMYRTADTIFH